MASQYRNHYVAGADDAAKCRELVAMGYMAERPSSALTGGDPLFHVTPAGVDVVALQSPAPPKLTRSQKRYREYLKDADCFESFRHFLRASKKTRGDYRMVSRDDEAKPIPISAAQTIADNFGYDQVVILARKVGESGMEHVTTYGRNKVHCDIAARMGEVLRFKILGWPMSEAKPK